MTYIDKEKTRSTAETGYLTPQVISRPNLTVALHAQVTRILFKTEGQLTRAVGVEFAKTRNGPRYQVSARVEVLIWYAASSSAHVDLLTRVSGGAVHTPHILKLSGVGPAEELNKFSIPVIKDIPGVGAGLADHPVVYATFRTRQRRDYNDLSQFNLLRIKAMAQYTFFKEGPLTSNVRGSHLSTFLSHPSHPQETHRSQSQRHSSVLLIQRSSHHIYTSPSPMQHPPQTPLIWSSSQDHSHLPPIEKRWFSVWVPYFSGMIWTPSYASEPDELLVQQVGVQSRLSHPIRLTSLLSTPSEVAPDCTPNNLVLTRLATWPRAAMRRS